MILNQWELIGEKDGYFLTLTLKEYGEKPNTITIPVSNEQAEQIIKDTNCKVGKYPF